MAGWGKLVPGWGAGIRDMHSTLGWVHRDVESNQPMVRQRATLAGATTIERTPFERRPRPLTHGSLTLQLGSPARPSSPSLLEEDAR